jgi:tetratricopeptide (TPR) repeat protein
MPERFEVEWEGRWYLLSAGGFYDARTFLKPPKALQQHLKAVYTRELEHTVEKVTNPASLLKYSGIAKNLDYLDLALSIVTRVLVLEPQNGFAIARASSILRAKGQPEKALDVTNQLPESKQGHAVLTTRAAALCDLGRWPEALRVVRRALALLGSCPKIEATEALSVFERIRRCAPYLVTSSLRRQ